MYHLGVIKALFEQNLLPRVISGSSGGGIIAALICVTPDDKLSNVFDRLNWNLQAFQNVEASSGAGSGASLRRKLFRLLKKGREISISSKQ